MELSLASVQNCAQTKLQYTFLNWAAKSAAIFEYFLILASLFLESLFLGHHSSSARDAKRLLKNHAECFCGAKSRTTTGILVYCHFQRVYICI